MTEPVAQVALPLPLFEPYTYSIPESIADRVVPGARVVVPVRRRELVGIVLDVTLSAAVTLSEAAVLSEAKEKGPKLILKDILAAPNAEPALTPPMLRTAEWMAGYYGAPIGIALKAMLPAPMWGASRVILVAGTWTAGRLGGLAEELLEWVERKGGKVPLDTAARHFRKPLWEVADRLVRVGAAELVVEPADAEPGTLVERKLEIAGEPLTLVERDARFARRVKQRRLYETLEQLGGSISVKHLKDTLGMSDAVIRALAGSGLARVVKAERMRDPFEGEPGTPPPTKLTAEQAEVLGRIEALEPGSGALLFGVTGSGKTLVYLRAVERAVASGRGAIVLVPEIGLTPQMVSRVRGMFGNNVAVLHSGLSDGERADAWRLLRRGERRVAVGARSAVFAPVQELGLIVVDEEHEQSYKHGEAPRYHTRDVAAVRVQLEGARLVFGSATPSLESLAATEQKLTLIRLPERIGARPLPPV